MQRGNCNPQRSIRLVTLSSASRSMRISQPRRRRRQNIPSLSMRNLSLCTAGLPYSAGMRHLEPVGVGQRQFHVEMHGQIRGIAPVVRRAFQSVRIGQQAHAHGAADAAHVVGDQAHHIQRAALDVLGEVGDGAMELADVQRKIERAAQFDQTLDDPWCASDPRTRRSPVRPAARPTFRPRSGCSAAPDRASGRTRRPRPCAPA